ncbi:MAG: hypothetical protein JOZ10_17400 [Acidobacteria bacterium]|nr:hypothetical protein [Acidobacteriota bacterium]
MKAHIKEHPGWFHRFDAVWTPSALLLASSGKERVRLEGYLPRTDFVAALISGLGRIAFVQKNYPEAERWYDEVITRYGQSHSVPGAMYWRAVSHYKATNDHTVLGKVAEELRGKFRSSVWAAKSVPWLH